MAKARDTTIPNYLTVFHIVTNSFQLVQDLSANGNDDGVTYEV